MNYIHLKIHRQQPKLLISRNQFSEIIFTFEFNRFTEVLQNIRKRHSTVIETLAQVMNNSKKFFVLLDD